MFPGTLDQFLDPDGMVAPDIGVGSQNGVRYTSDAILGLSKKGLLTEEIKVYFNAKILACFKEPGLLRRAPRDGDQEGPDDYIACVSASKECGGELAKAILAYGLKPILLFGRPMCWVYNNVSPGVLDGSAYMGRFPAWRAHIKWAAGVEPTLLEKILWSGALLFSAIGNGRDQDGWVLSAHQVSVCPVRTGVLGVLVKFWKYMFKRAWPEGFRGLLERYFVPGHPLAELWDGLDRGL